MGKRGVDKYIQRNQYNFTAKEMPQLDNLIGVTIKMETPEGNVKTGTVKKRAVDDNGRGVGTHNDNSLLDSRQYEIEFEDGTYDRYQANESRRI